MSKKLSMPILNRLLENAGDIALRRRARTIIEELDPKDGERILDVGCGDGYYLYLLFLLKLDLKLVGVDNDRRALESARKNLKTDVKLVEADLIKELPFKDETFDKVVASEVVEHLAYDAQGLKEVYRVLKTGGVAAISVPNYNFPFLWDPVNWILQNIFGTHVKTGFWAGIWNQHLRLYNPIEIKRVVEKVGFKVQKTYVQTFWSLPFNHYLINLGARVLSKGTLPGLITGANKFKEEEKKSFIPKLYFFMTNLFDKLNDLWIPKNTGVSIVLTARKDDNV